MFVIERFILQFKILRNSFRRDKERYFFSFLIHGMIFVVMLSLFYLFLIYMFGFADKRQMQAFDFAASLFSFSLLVFTPLLIYSSIICALYYLFEKEESGFIFSSPVKITQVFAVRFLQVYYKSSWMAFLGISVFIIAIHNYFHIPAGFYLGSIFATAAYLLIPVCLGVMLTLILSRIIPFVRAKGILTVIGLFVGSLLMMALRMMQPERLVSAQGRLSLLTFVQQLHSPWMTVFPSEWLNNTCVSYYQGDTKGVGLNILMLSSVAVFLLLITYLLAKRFYFYAWTQSLVIPAVYGSASRWEILLKLFPKQLRPFIKKDILTFYRDTVERGSLLLFIPITILYLYSIYVLVRYIRNYGTDFFSFLYQYLFNLFYLGVVICGLAGRWVFPSISVEGSNFRLLRISAVPIRQFIREKLWLGFIPLFILGSILVAGSCFIMGLSPPLTLLTAALALIITFGITVIAIILGMKMADFSVKEPLDFALGYPGFIFLAASFSFVSAVIIITGIALAIYSKNGFGYLSSFAILSASLLGAAVFYLGLYLPYQRGVLSIEGRDIN